MEAKTQNIKNKPKPAIVSMWKEQVMSKLGLFKKHKLFYFQKSINATRYINIKTFCTIISIDAENAFHKI